MNCIYTSILSRIGEGLGSSSLFSLATSALSIDENYIFGCGYSNDFFPMANKNIQTYKNGIFTKELKYVAVNSINIGGSASCSILKKTD